jgi:hypothetical protein
LNKARQWTLEAAQDIYASFPVPIRGLDSDGGAEFINWHFKGWCEENEITFTRGRSHHSNDNCFVEQKNGDVVRKNVGYARFEGAEALAALKAVYAVLCPLINYFHPTKKLIAKETLPNGKVKKIYEKQLKTPYQRVLEHPDVPDPLKDKLRQTMSHLDIVALQEALDTATANLDMIARKNRPVQTEQGDSNG